MSLAIRLFVAVTILGPQVSWAISLDSLASIECRDVAQGPELEVYLTTTSPAAQKYTRKKGQIPYEYGNAKAPFRGFSTGVFSLKNNPEAEGGRWILMDSSDTHNIVTLELRPTGAGVNYDGVLTGPIETRQGWGLLVPHALNCSVHEARPAF